MIRFPIYILLMQLGASPFFSPEQKPAPYNGCRTVCGMYAPLATDCTALQLNELKILVSYSEYVKGWTVERMCHALQGYVLIVSPYADKRGSWLQPLGPKKHKEAVLGITDLDNRAIFVGLYDWDRSALAHEMGHVFRRELDKVQAGHSLWTPLGLCNAINRASKLKDDCDGLVYTGKAQEK